MDEQPDDTKAKASEPSELYADWIAQIEKAEQERNPFWTVGATILKKYRDQSNNDKGKLAQKGHYNLFWSNVETGMPATYSATPQPAVARRFYDADPVARLASTILERTLVVQVDSYDFDKVMEMANKDLWVSGLGQAWAEYICEREPDSAQPDPSGQLGDDGTPLMVTVPGKLISESTRCRYVAWNDYLEGPGRTWDEVPWVGKREYFTKEDLAKIPGIDPKIIKDIPLDAHDSSTANPGGYNNSRSGAGAPSEYANKVCVYDIWDKASKTQRLWVRGYNKGPIRDQPDPLRLKDFFPCPRPIEATTTNDTRIPVADYAMIQHQLAELDELTERFRILTKALKVAGVYNGQAGDLKKVLTATDNTLIKVDSWAAFAEKGGIKGAMEFLPIAEIAQVAIQVQSARQVVKNDIAELTGFSDLVRGQTNPNETLGAQQLKSQYNNRRISTRQKEVARFARDLMRLKGEIIAEHFSPQTIWEAAGCAYMPEAVAPTPPPPAQQPGMPAPAPIGPPPPPQPGPDFTAALDLLKNDKMRTFRIDIETDSTIAPDENAEKQRATELVTSLGAFMPSMIEMSKESPQIAPVLGDVLLFVLRRFRVGRGLEAEFEQAVDKMKKQPAAPPPDPNAAANAQAANEMKMAQQKQQFEMQLEQQKMIGELQMERQRMEGELANDRLEQAGKLQLQAHTARLDRMIGLLQPQPAA